jgi:predicted acyl esterase
MAPITNLFGAYAYPSSGSDWPIAVLMHSMSNGAAADFPAATLARIARFGLFAVAVGMRGRDSASGSQDASGREIYDLYDVLAHVRSNFPLASATHAGVIGYSGGGGNALAAACKTPDAFTVVASHFGPSDLGRDATNGWYNQAGGPKATLESWVGDTPTNVPDNYWARDATYALGANYSGGHLYLFHDLQDTSVPPVHSTRATDSMDASSRTNYTASYTNTGDSPRWLHSMPNGGAQVEQTESVWAAALAAKTHSVWTIPASGTVKVLGYIKTKRFSIFLSTGAAEVADVAYNTATDSYTVTPQTGTMDVIITQGAKTASQTINSETTIIVS